VCECRRGTLLALGACRAAPVLHSPLHLAAGPPRLPRCSSCAAHCPARKTRRATLRARERSLTCSVRVKQVLVHTWRDATLSELTELLAQEHRQVRQSGTKCTFKVLTPAPGASPMARSTCMPACTRVLCLQTVVPCHRRPHLRRRVGAGGVPECGGQVRVEGSGLHRHRPPASRRHFHADARPDSISGACTHEPRCEKTPRSPTLNGARMRLVSRHSSRRAHAQTLCRTPSLMREHGRRFARGTMRASPASPRGRFCGVDRRWGRGDGEQVGDFLSVAIHPPRAAGRGDEKDRIRSEATRRDGDGDDDEKSKEEKSGEKDGDKKDDDSRRSRSRERKDADDAKK